MRNRARFGGRSEAGMTPADLHAAARQLGLTGNGMAAALGISKRTWRRWLAGQDVPRPAVLAIAAMLREAVAAQCKGDE